MAPEKTQKMDLLIGERIRLARKEAGLTQEQFAQKLDFLKSRQVLDNIESGKRKVKADELITIMSLLGKTLDYFTDPFLVLGEHVFAWRVDRQSCAVDDYEPKARSIVGAYRHFCELIGAPPSPLVATLAINARSSYEEAQAAGERLAQELKLGDIPAEKLAKAVDEKLGVHILNVDAPDGVSGAACHLADMRFILVNRREPIGRRNYDLAHELFHVLTWNELPPDKIEVTVFKRKAPRAEKLADNFAASLLMPEEALRRTWESTSSDDITDRINETAKTFVVSSVALKYRLMNLKMIDDGDLLRIDDLRLKWVDTEPLPSLYSEAFVRMLHEVLDKGRLSVRRAAGLLGCMIDEMKELFDDYGMKSPFDL